MAIELGLSRISKLLQHLGNPQNKINVLRIAGTNGKGSVCSLLQSVLQTNANYQVGKFTSPHLVHITDCITVNGKSITVKDYNGIRSRLQEVNETHKLGCTEFEVLTCTAFEYFQIKKCNWWVLEVGLGGRLDATNCSLGANKICGITKIGMDHQGFLGNTLEQIGTEKAGIIVPGVQFVAVDGTNDPKVLDVIKKRTDIVHATSSLTNSIVSDNVIKTKSWGNIDRDIVPLNGDYQMSNIAVALSLLDYLQGERKASISLQQLKDGLQNVRWPGRLQNVLYYTEGKHEPLKLLIDGAHNGDAAIALSRYIDQHVRDDDNPITFVIAVTQGKTLEPLLSPLIKPQDRVIVTRFGPVEGMPWITAMTTSDLISHVSKYTKNVSSQPSVQKAIDQASESCSNPTVLCGSLYLCGELLRTKNVNS
ncbi:LANO_0D07294g1_1 [Lachancea nothofagi CBS 11611]|uniref:Dihydrofolate synthetase n=1 Tax=Lachancea nothofagi CBS 11611 TaxID=1266666 RepID=A0A1G4JHX6_9SACH|nr:LANO_0D07294g1_1 [Lachancea nothofagi CBS 11611]